MPSGLNATLHTQPVCPCKGAPRGWPVAASHRRTVLSPLPEARVLPSGLNATLRTLSVCPCRGAPRGGRWRRPTGARSCRCRGDEGLAVGAERDAPYPLRVPLQGRAAGEAGSGVPQAHGLVAAAGGEGLAVGAERDAPYPVRVPLQGRAAGAAGGDVPQAQGLVVAARGEGLAVGAERDARHQVRVPVQGRAAGEAGGGVPQAHGVVPRGDRRSAIRADRTDEVGKTDHLRQSWCRVESVLQGAVGLVVWFQPIACCAE